jgi:RES domain
MNAADIPEEAAQDIQIILEDEHGSYDDMGEESEFSEDAHYEKIMPGDEEWQASWRKFEKTIKSEARFFSRTAARQLGALFDDIDKMRTREGRPLIVTVGPGTEFPHLFRARVFQSGAKLRNALERPDRELAAPPSAFAAAGRMNAKGISAFYGATDPEIALAEVRPPVGSEVAIARFVIIRALRLLDLNALKDVHETGSIFDPTYATRLSRMMFLRSLCERISRPVMPDDQDFEYLPTQAIADYLATEGKVPLDGIIFPSVQAGGGGLNVVLFHKAARCEEMDLPEGTEIEVSTGTQYEEGWERDYSVTETVPEAELDKPKAPSYPFYPLQFEWEGWEGRDDREAALCIDPDSVTIRLVEAVRFEASKYNVSRHRLNKQKDLPF